MRESSMQQASLDPQNGEALHTYSGGKQDVLDRIGQPWRSSTFDSDLSGRHVYRFNSLGFRSDEFLVEKPFRAFIFGESDAFGLGVNFDDIWTVRVARAKAAEAGFSCAETCIMNFADSGASNAAIARTLVSQCAAVRPDLVLVQFAKDSRVELLYGESNDAGRPYEEFYSEEQGLYQTLLDALLMQEFARNRGLQAIAIANDVGRFRSGQVLGDPRLGPLAASLGSDFLLDVQLGRGQVDDPGAIDAEHMGPNAHANVVRRVLSATKL